MAVNGLCDSDSYLCGAARALGFMKTAMHTINVLDATQLKDAEYHAYFGVSAARTAIDATACWLDLILGIGQGASSKRDLAKKPFRNKVVAKKSTVQTYVEALGSLAKTVDLQRQKAQHRDGLVLTFHSESQKKDHQKGWYLETEESQGKKELDLHLIPLLKEWKNEIEKSLFLMHHELWYSILSEEDMAIAIKKNNILENMGAWAVPTNANCCYHS